MRGTRKRFDPGSLRLVLGPLEQGAVANFDAESDCHWPALNVAPKTFQAE